MTGRLLPAFFSMDSHCSLLMILCTRVEIDAALFLGGRLLGGILAALRFTNGLGEFLTRFLYKLGEHYHDF